MNKIGKIYLAISSIVILILFLLLLFFRNIPSEAAIGFLGVLVGSTIAGGVQLTVSSADATQQLKLAALDKRLQAHQDAFAMWQRLLFTNRPTKESDQLILECQDWWNNNCLYLSADARIAFKEAYLAAEYLKLPANVQSGPKATNADLEKLKRAGEILVKGAYLPSIGEGESKRFETKNAT
jgi:hypothetical protein